MKEFFEKSVLEQDVVQEILASSSGSGYVLRGIETSLFLWRSDRRLEQLLVALASWVEAGEGYYIAYWKDSSAPKGVALGKYVVKGKPVRASWRLTSGGYSTLEVSKEANPFL